MSISGVAQHPLRNPQAQQPDRHWPAWRPSPSIRRDAGKKPATLFHRGQAVVANPRVTPTPTDNPHSARKQKLTVTAILKDQAKLFQVGTACSAAQSPVRLTASARLMSIPGLAGWWLPAGLSGASTTRHTVEAGTSARSRSPAERCASAEGFCGRRRKRSTNPAPDETPETAMRAATPMRPPPVSDQSRRGQQHSHRRQ